MAWAKRSLDAAERRRSLPPKSTRKTTRCPGVTADSNSTVTSVVPRRTRAAAGPDSTTSSRTSNVPPSPVVPTALG